MARAVPCVTSPGPLLTPSRREPAAAPPLSTQATFEGDWNCAACEVGVGVDTCGESEYEVCCCCGVVAAVVADTAPAGVPLVSIAACVRGAGIINMTFILRHIQTETQTNTRGSARHLGGRLLE